MAGIESGKAVYKLLPSIAPDREFRGKLSRKPVYTRLAGPCYVFVQRLIPSGANPGHRGRLQVPEYNWVLIPDVVKRQTGGLG